MALVTLENLARYDGNAKDRSKSLYASASAANWQKTEKAGAVTCWPVPETDLEPVVEFLFKETLPASGSKGAGNPSTIVGVSNVTIVRGSSNIASIPRNKTQTFTDGTVFSSDSDGRITITGTPTADRHTQGTSLTAEFIPNLPVGRYLVSAGVDTHNSSVLVHIVKANGGNSYPAATLNLRNKAFYIEEGDVIHDIRVQTYSGTTYNETVFPCLSLYGVGEDISASESYIVEFPSTFYGGTLDVASGKLSVTHRMVEPSSETVDIADFPAKLPLDCTDTYGRTITSADGTSLSVGSSGGQIVYKLAVPYSVYIDAVKIPSLPALDIHSPRLNTIYTDALNVQVGYQKHPRRTEEEIQNAILALGGNV